MKKNVKPNEKNEPKWLRIDNITETFIIKGEPEKIHIIKTGFVDKYIIVFEDALEGPIEVSTGTKFEIEERFGIKLKDTNLADLILKETDALIKSCEKQVDMFNKLGATHASLTSGAMLTAYWVVQQFVKENK